MTPDEHQRERMTRWTRAFDTCATDGSGTDHCGAYADNALAEFDKRFPAPSAAAPVEPDGQFFIPPAELATLRQKARLWDAVASGKVRLSVAGRAYCTWALGSEMTPLCDTAEEAVESAIAQGALK